MNTQQLHWRCSRPRHNSREWQSSDTATWALPSSLRLAMLAGFNKMPEMNPLLHVLPPIRPSFFPLPFHHLVQPSQTASYGPAPVVS